MDIKVEGRTFNGVLQKVLNDLKTNGIKCSKQGIFTLQKCIELAELKYNTETLSISTQPFWVRELHLEIGDKKIRKEIFEQNLSIFIWTLASNSKNKHPQYRHKERRHFAVKIVDVESIMTTYNKICPLWPFC